MKFELHMFFRRLFMIFFRKNCDSCVHYDGKFGSDKCFECERSIEAVGYEQRGA